MCWGWHSRLKVSAVIDDLRDVQVAVVHKAGRPAAELHRVGSHVEFRLRDEYDGPAVATNLLEDVTGLPAGAVPPFFAGLLPEGRRLSALRRTVATSADDELTLLLAVGGDTVGDVQVAPRGVAPTSAAPRFDAAEAGEVRFEDLLAASVGTDPERVALPGVQEKVSARTAHAPVRSGALSDAILKFETGDFPLRVANERSCLDAVRAAGLAAAEHKVLHDVDGVPGLLVRRFDRVHTGGSIVARGQQDACQTLGLWPADKYRPDLVEVVAGLSAACRAPVVAALRLWEQVAFSYLVANGDHHAKNISIVHDGTGWMPSPIYDVMFTHPYGDTDSLALPLAGERNVARIDRPHLLAAATDTGVAAAALERRLDQLLTRTADVPARLSELGFPGSNPNKLRRVLEQRRARLAAQ